MDTIPLTKAALITGIAYDTLKTRYKRKQINCLEEWNGRKKVLSITLETLNSLRQSVEVDNYQRHYDDWVRLQAVPGYLARKGMTPKSVAANIYGLKKFWQYSGAKPSIENLNRFNLERALLAVPIDHVKKKCHFTQRDQLYKAYRSFTYHLIKQGLRSQANIDDTKPLKPGRIYDANQPVLTWDELQKLFRLNDYTYCRVKNDRLITKTLIGLMAYAGLRVSEVCNLGINDVNLSAGTIHVWDSKGHKSRVIGIIPPLVPILIEWLSIRGQYTKGEYFIVTSKGTQCKHKQIYDKIKRLIIDGKGNKVLDINPHGLRATAITLWIIRYGISLPDAMNNSGHADLKSLQIYLRIAGWQSANVLSNVVEPTQSIPDQTLNPHPAKRWR